MSAAGDLWGCCDAQTKRGNVAQVSAPQPPDERVPPGGPRAGDRVRVRYTKWGGWPHWEWDALVLGEDEHGTWLHMAAGTRMARPGLIVDEEVAWVALAPRGEPWVAGFYPDPKWLSIYVDMTTVPRWVPLGEPGSWELAMVDLDLDVVLTREGRLFVDDEDEFEQHRVELGYPDDVVELALRSRDWVHAAIEAGAEPFGRAGRARVAQVSRSAPT